jgi:hypothetical protein
MRRQEKQDRGLCFHQSYLSAADSPHGVSPEALSRSLPGGAREDGASVRMNALPAGCPLIFTDTWGRGE